MKKFCFGFFLLISIVINILFSINWYVGGGVGRLRWDEKRQIDSVTELSWTKKAAAEAEAVAAVSCSGHGKAYVDGLTFEGQPICECDDCYGGFDCSEFDPQCAVDVESGDVLYSEPFWEQHAINSAVLISGWHRMSYEYADKTMMSSELEKYIRKLHSVVGNAITEGRYLVYGVGSAQLLNAAIYALSSRNVSSPTTILASVPFYPLFKGQMDLFDSKIFEFGGDTNTWKKDHTTENTDVLEVVTSPNNPDGVLMKQILDKKAIYDNVFYWPHFTPIPAPLDEDFMIYSLSKLTGHAGMRFGWAVIKDKGVYEKILEYIKLAEIGVSRDTQVRALKILKVIVEGDNGKQFFNYAYGKMSDRWRRLTPVFSKSTRFSIQKRHPLHCNFFNETRIPYPAFAWVKCEWEEDEDCLEVLRQEGNIIGNPGTWFLAEGRYVRLALTKSEENFDLLLQRLTELISLENGGAKSMRKLK